MLDGKIVIVTGASELPYIFPNRAHNRITGYDYLYRYLSKSERALTLTLYPIDLKRV